MRGGLRFATSLLVHNIRRLAHILSLLIGVSGGFSALSEERLLLDADPDKPKVSLEEAVFGFTNDFDALYQLVNKIYRSCPPNRCLYVGLGRSPTPVIAFMKAKYGDSAAINVPVTSLKQVGTARTENPELHKEYSQYLHQHFAEFLPSAEELAGREIYMIDFVLTGQNLVESLYQVREYYERSAAGKVKVQALALVGDEYNEEWIFNPNRADCLTVNLDPILARRMAWKEYRDFAEYDRLDWENYILGQYQKTKKRGGQFQSLVDAYAIRLREPITARPEVQTPKSLWQKALSCVSVLKL